MSSGTPSPHGPRVAAVVLAAGRSSRMAPRNKLLALVGGVPMVRLAVAVAVESGARPVIVVTGYDASRVTAVLDGLPIVSVGNPSHADGLSTSLKAGLGALPEGIEGALICLADMPWVEANVLQALIDAFANKGPDAICVPVRHGRRGNPVLWGRPYFREMMTVRGDRGAKPLMALHASAIVEVEVATDSIFQDIDVIEDLAGSKSRCRAERT
jgi:molybdenum cofactor cytidylyltransferase